MKHMSAVVGETIAFSVCNKPFKLLGLPIGRVKSREGLPEMILINIEALFCCQTRIFTQTHSSYIMSRFNKMNITSSSRYPKSINS